MNEGIELLHKARALLAAASNLLGRHGSSEAAHFARRVASLIPCAEKELRGEKYVCRCCGAVSFSPFGSDETICGSCHNGIHYEHEPTAEVAALNQKMVGHPGRRV